MKKRLIIDFTNELLIKFQLEDNIEAKDIILNISGKEKSFKLLKEGNYYIFKVEDSIFSDENIGRILFSFTYKNKNDEVNIANFSKFKKFKIINNKIKKINNVFVIINQTKGRNFGLFVVKNIKETNINTDNFLKSLNYNKNEILIEGKFKSFSLPIKNIEMSLEGRKFSKFISPIDFETKGKYNDDFLISSKFKIDPEIEEDNYDMFVIVYLHGINETFKIRFGRTRYIYKRGLNDFTFKNNENTIFISPYITMTGINVSLKIEKVSNNILNDINHVKMDKNKHVWMVGEKSDKAQDNGKAFFEYLRRCHPEVEAYYIIDFKSAEYDNVSHLDNLIDFRSKKHFEIALKSTHIFSSHYPEFLYPVTNKKFKSRIKAKKIFLQHGVIGIKNLNQIYINQKRVFDTDMFCVSSEREKQIVMENLEFPEEQIKLTGIPRFDSLFKEDTKVKKQVLIFPTWRLWLQNLDVFLESEYFKRYHSLLSNKELLKVCNKNNIEIIFCLHPNMQRYASFFKNDNVKVVSQEEVNVQQLIKESIMMISDYSSVILDFSFLNKPIIIYQFDQKRFYKKGGHYLDLEREVPGQIVNNENDLIDLFKTYLNNDFKMSEKYKKRSEKLLKYKDTNNSERVYREALKFDYKPSVIQKIQTLDIYIKGFNRFRRSFLYFPLMKFLFYLFKLLPLKDRYVFESAFGKQYSDSPKAIYEELIKVKNVPCIWVYDKTSFIHPIETKIVKRYSPKYFYYLATSKYWINNQNFPSYITKRKKTKYIQTWHGTPLKKMLNDIKKIHGRDKGYYGRVTKSISQWSFLLSPNHYSTEKFRSAFKYDGPVVEEGYPRNDLLINRNEEDIIINKIKNHYSISDHDKKIILYAPTFRDNHKINDKFQINIPIDFKRFNDIFGKEYILFIRAHSQIKSKFEIPTEYKDSIIDVSNYSDIQELYLITDILITDYSSSFFDFAILERPMLFYAYDWDEYVDEIRGTYLDYEKTVPGKIVKTQEELFDGIKNISSIHESYHQKLIEFKEKYSPKDDGNASKRIVDKLLMD